MSRHPGLSIFHKKSIPIKQLKGFEVRYQVPTSFEPKSVDFVHRIGTSDIAEEIDLYFSKLRKVYSFKRKELKTFGPVDGNGSIQTPLFDVHWEMTQSSFKPAIAEMVSCFSNFDDLNEVTSTNFQMINGTQRWSIMKHVAFDICLESLVDEIEDLDVDSIGIEYDRDVTLVELFSENATGRLKIDKEGFEFVVKEPCEPKLAFLQYLSFQKALGELQSEATSSLFG